MAGSVAQKVPTRRNGAWGPNHPWVTHICKHVSSPGFYLTASFSVCSYGSPISLMPDGDLEVWQVAGGIQPRWGKLKPKQEG